MPETESLYEILKNRVLVSDDPMGPNIQQLNLSEMDFRGKQFSNHPNDLKGNYDILSITKPEIVERIHRQLLEAGTDIIETNTFNANRISQSDYGLEAICYRMNYESAKLLKKLADEFSQKNPDKPRFVAGVLGPTKKNTSLSPDWKKL